MTTCASSYPRKTVLVPPLSRAGNVALIFAASLFIALMAHVRLPLPFTPVPVTGQTFAVLVVGAVLGSRRGTAAVLAYLAEGLLGLPVFAGGAGLAYALGPTGGYLLGFVAAAFLTGLLAERGGDRRFASAWVGFLLGEAAIYALGVPWLAHFVGFPQAVAMGLLPFIVGDLAKALVAGLLLPIAWQWGKTDSA